MTKHMRRNKPHPGETGVSLFRGGQLVSTLTGAFGQGLRETRLTALLGYLMACKPKPFLDLFGLAGSLSGARVARELDAVIARRGAPLMCVSDNGTELTGMAILRWAQERGIEWHYIAPGKPQQNTFAESFIGRLRDECLNESLFESLASARQILEHWRIDYNTVRPHSALGNVPPAAYANVNASGVQRAGALELLQGSAPRPVAPPSPSGSDEPRTLLIPG
jgi:putative transposase